MDASSVSAELAKIENPQFPAQDKSQAYLGLLKQIVSSTDSHLATENLSAFVSSITNDQLGIVTARPLLNAYVDALRSVESPEVRIDSGKFALQALEPRSVSFEDQDAKIREILADAYQQMEQYIEAAKVLQGIQLDSSQQKATDEAKVKMWIRICRLYLEEDDTTNAEAYLNRAKTLLFKVSDPEVNLTFELSRARILDSSQKFLDASQAYHNVSISPILAEEERLQALAKSIVCAVLSPAGPSRSRALSKLYKDERATQLEEFGMLEKMFLDQIIPPDEVNKFAEKLDPHQLAKRADGTTVLAKAVTEHNLLGASKLYMNLSIEDLGRLLGLDPEKAEEYAGRMLQQGRLNGSIDQIEEYIFFDDPATMAKAGMRNGHQEDWDGYVQTLIEDIERVSSLVPKHD